MPVKVSELCYKCVGARILLNGKVCDRCHGSGFEKIK
jgi:hypothetical protein